MALSWSGRRQLLYIAVAAVVVAAVGAWGYEAFFTQAPTCFDGKQNGDETGVDCGGGCALVCAAQAHDPIVLWARAFATGSTTYTAAAYIQNNNVGAGARQVRYAFELFDAQNSLIIERDGVADLPPIPTIPIVEPNITVGNRVVAHVQFSFTDTPPAVWQKIPATAYPALAVSQLNLSPDASELSATLSNNTLNTAKAVSVAAVLFDSSGVARAASKSDIGTVPGKSSQPVVFTWPSGVPNIVKADIIVLPSF